MAGKPFYFSTESQYRNFFSTPDFALSSANLYAPTQPGGINVFGGGLALYDSNGTLVGAVGVSGDTSCADHNIAMRVRNKIGFNNVPAGVNNGTDNIIYDAQAGNNNGALDGFEHPECGNNEVNVNNNIQNFLLNN